MWAGCRVLDLVVGVMAHEGADLVHGDQESEYCIRPAIFRVLEKFGLKVS